MRKAVCLLSGGLDSSVTAALASKEYEVYCLTVDYGQRHRKEIEAAKRVAEWFGAKEHNVIKLNLKQLSRSALLSEEIEVPKGRSVAEIKSAKRIPPTYVPARNMILLSLAFAYAETIGAEVVFVGANVLDYSGYPDCRLEFLEAFEKAAALGTKAGVEGKPIRIEAPLIHKSKAEIVKLGYELGLPFELTWSCYEGGERPCGACDACVLRKEAFRRAGVEDPLER